MRSPNIPRLAPLPLLCWLLCCAAMAGADASFEEGILLIDHPPLHADASVRTPSKPTDWKPRKTLFILATKQSNGETWYCVSAQPPTTKGEPSRTAWLPEAYLAPPPIPIDGSEDAPVASIPVDRHHGLPPDYQPADLVSIRKVWRYQDKINYRLRREAAAALDRMLQAAREEGIRMWVLSAYRSWDKQQHLYEHRLRKSGRHQSTVARPGHSEHQLGLAVDLTDGNLETLLKPAFADTRAGRWLRKNAPRFGFAQSYTSANQSRTGFSAEPWHYRYWGTQEALQQHQQAFAPDPSQP